MNDLFAEVEQEDRRREQVSQHLKNMRSGWREWPGPAVGGLIEVDSITAYSLTHGEERYYYCAPCRIVAIEDKGETFIAEIEYDEDSPRHCRNQNGTRLRLDITEIWPPTRELWKARHARERMKTK